MIHLIKNSISKFVVTLDEVDIPDIRTYDMHFVTSTNVDHIIQVSDNSAFPERYNEFNICMPISNTVYTHQNEQFKVIINPKTKNAVFEYITAVLDPVELIAVNGVCSFSTEISGSNISIATGLDIGYYDYSFKNDTVLYEIGKVLISAGSEVVIPVAYAPTINTYTYKNDK